MTQCLFCTNEVSRPLAKTCGSPECRKKQKNAYDTEYRRSHGIAERQVSDVSQYGQGYCMYCSNPVRHSTDVTCGSPECRKKRESELERRRRHSKRKTFPARRCGKCGETFTPPIHNQTTCPACLAAKKEKPVRQKPVAAVKPEQPRKTEAQPKPRTVHHKKTCLCCSSTMIYKDGLCRLCWNIDRVAREAIERGKTGNVDRDYRSPARALHAVKVG